MVKKIFSIFASLPFFCTLSNFRPTRLLFTHTNLSHYQFSPFFSFAHSVNSPRLYKIIYLYIYNIYERIIKTIRKCRRGDKNEVASTRHCVNCKCDDKPFHDTHTKTAGGTADNKKLSLLVIMLFSIWFVFSCIEFRVFRNALSLISFSFFVQQSGEKSTRKSDNGKWNEKNYNKKIKNKIK